MKPITEAQAADLALEMATRFDLSVHQTSLLISFARRIYAEGRCFGTLERVELVYRQWYMSPPSIDADHVVIDVKDAQ